MSFAIAAAGLVTTTLLATGSATFIADDLQQQVLENRIRFRQLEPDPRAVGYCALQTCDRLGELVIISWPTGYAGPYQVIDCGAAEDQPYLDQINFGVEVSETEWRTRANPGHPTGAQVSVYLAEQLPATQPTEPHMPYRPPYTAVSNQPQVGGNCRVTEGDT